MGSKTRFRGAGRGNAAPAPEPIIALNFIQPVSAANEALIRDVVADFEAGFLSRPMEVNGDDRILVDVLVNNDAPFDGNSGGLFGQGTRAGMKPDGTTRTGTIRLEEASMGLPQTTIRPLILHELLHVLGFGTNPTWVALSQGAAETLVFVGPQALAEYRALPGGFPDADGIPLQVSGGGHWYGDNGTPHATGQDCLDHELMSPNNEGSNTFSRVTAAALRDLGYDYDVNAALPFVCGGA